MDSLCIVQDDEGTTKDQISKMASIYANADTEVDANSCFPELLFGRSNRLMWLVATARLQSEVEMGVQAGHI